MSDFYATGSANHDPDEVEGYPDAAYWCVEVRRFGTEQGFSVIFHEQPKPWAEVVPGDGPNPSHDEVMEIVRVAAEEMGIKVERCEETKQ